jgi:toxin ParE1/3/4
MTMLPVVPRELARADVEQAIEHYLAQAGRDVAFAFIDALEAAYAAIAANPAAATPCWGLELHLPGLRSYRLGIFPYLVFFIEREGCIDVWRVLHARQDIPSWLQDEDAG